ncbi:MAG: hypothetical protein KGH53_00215 [Candidatus Micrarchaeota archaeon]|nr:hypothetical protein [Candidatus Micrarchaeota archaeon]
MSIELVDKKQIRESILKEVSFSTEEVKKLIHKDHLPPQDNLDILRNAIDKVLGKAPS